MYPHRPPVISKVESPSNRIQRIVVTEAPPTNTSAAASTTTRLQEPVSCGSTVVYNQWSPVMRLGDLLQFVIVLLTNPTLAAAAALSSTTYHNHRAAALSTNRLSAPSPTQAAFVEEHKMEEYHDKAAEGAVDFAPNRFEAGYGKYLDPIASTAAWAANPMDVN